MQPFVTRDHPVLVAAARHALPGVSPPERPAVIRAKDLEAIRTFCRTDRLSGLLAAAVRAGDIECDHLEALDDDWHEALHGCVLIEALLLRVAERLDAAGIRWMLTKGSALAHLDYRDPALRTFADVDVIVHPDDWTAAVDELVTDRHTRPRALAFVERYGKGCTTTIDDMEVDLHRRFAVGRFGLRCRIEECFERSESFELGGRRIPVPARSDRLLHACFHAALGGEAELRAFRDVAQLALGWPSAVDAAWGVARSWGVEAVMARAIEETWRRLDLPADHEVAVAARRVRIDRIDATTLDVFARHDPFRRQALTTLTALPVREHPRFVYDAWRMSREHTP